MTVTFDQVVSWGPCREYREDGGARLLELYPSKEAELIDILRDDRIPVEDRVWLGCHALPWETIQPVVTGWVDRAIRRCLGKSGVPAWETWAEKWLSGEDRAWKKAVGASAAAVAGAWAARAAWWAAVLTTEASRADADAWAAVREEEVKKQLEEITEVVVNMKGA